MAKKNKKGTPFMGLGLDKPEEKRLQEILKELDKSGKQLMRSLFRKFIKEYDAKSKENHG